MGYMQAFVTYGMRNLKKAPNSAKVLKMLA